MANTVQIVVSVDNAQANAALAQTTTQLKNLSSTASMTNSQWTGMQGGLVQTTQGMFRVGEAAQKMNGHMATSLDGVRLLSQEFGLRLPRALESILSRMPAVTSAISGAMSGLAAFAVVEVLMRAGEAVYNLYNKYISLTAAADAYNKEVQKHRDEDFINAHSIETATQRINEATNAAKQFNDLGEEVRKGAWSDILSFDPARMAQGFGGLVMSRKDVDQGYKSRAQSDAMNPKMLSQQNELNLMQIEAAHAADGELRGQQKINAELQKRLAINRENQNYTRSQDAILQGGASRSSGQQKRDLEDQQARAEAGAQRVELERQITQKTASLQAEATNAALVGNQLLTAQKLQAEEEIRRSGVGTSAEIDAIERKFHNEQMKRLKEEQDAVDKRAHTEAEAALTTYAKLQAEGQDRISDISQKQAKGLYADQAKPGDPSALADKDRATAQAGMLRTMTEAQKRFDEEQQSALDRSTSEQLGAFAKIDADLQQRLQKRADEYTKFYGDLTQQDAIHLAATAQLTAQNDEDVAAAARQRAQVEQQIHDQTLQRDREAAQAEAKGRAEGFGSWQERYHATINQIEAEHTAMIAKINAEASKPGVTASALADYQRQKVDADAIANAQIEDANQQLAHSIAGTLEGAFDTPIKSIQKKFEKMFFDIAAQWLAHSGMFGQAAPGGGSAPGSTAPGASGNGGAISGVLRSVGIGGIGGGSGAGSGYSSSPVGQLLHHMGHPAAAISAPTPSQASSMSTPSIGASSTSTGVGISATSSTSSQGSPSTGMYGFSGDASTSSPASAVTFPVSSTAAPSNAGTGAPGSTPISGASAAGSFGSLASTTGSALSASGNGGTTSAGLGAAGSLIGAGVGAYTGFMGVESSFESGKASGILSGAASGATLGGSIGMLAGPEGAAIGAGIGAAAGATAGLVGWASGEGGRLGGAQYYKNTMLPQMEQTARSYSNGGGTATAAMSALDNVVQGGMTTLFQKYGSSAAAWVRDSYITKEQHLLIDQIDRLAGGGHDYVAASAVQFHGGGTIRDFGDLATSGNEGFIHAMLDEKVTNPGASRTHGPYIDAMNAGASESDVAGMYLRNSGVGGAGGDTHVHNYGDVHVSAIDSADVSDWLSNRGGMDAIAQAQNQRNAAYGGDGY